MSDALHAVKKRSGKFVLELSRGRHEVAYLKLPSYPSGQICKMSKSVRLFDMIGKYPGPDVILDFDEEGVLVGIEILAE